MPERVRRDAVLNPNRKPLLTSLAVLSLLATAPMLQDESVAAEPAPRLGKATAPDFESDHPRRATGEAEKGAPVPGTPEVAPAGGAWVRLRDVRPTQGGLPPAPAQPRAGGRAVAAAADETRTKTPTSPPSPPPISASRAPGAEVRSIEGINGVEAARIPPDTELAVGPAHTVQVVNAGLSVYGRLGTRWALGPANTQFWAFEDFFGGNLPTGWQGFLFGPRVVWDPLRDRFVLLVLGRDDAAQESYAFLALSETSDPTESWCTRRITTTDTSGASPAWLDFAGLGVDTWGFYLTGNAIFWSGGKRGAQIRSFGTDIYDDCTQPLAFTRFANVQWPSGGQADSLQFARAHTINGNEESFFVGTRPDSGDEVLLATLSGDRANLPTLTRVEIAIPAYDAIGENVDQPGSAVDLDGGRSNVQNAVYANRRIYFALTDDVMGDGSASGWLTVKLDTDTETMTWHHLLWSGLGTYYFYPALTVRGTSANANIAVFGSYTDAETALSAATNFPSGVFKIYENHPVDATGPLVVTSAGEAPYVRLDTDGINRWGNYAGAQYDWTCGQAWGVVQSAGTANRWETTILAREFDDEGPCPRIEVVAPAEGTVWTAGTNQSIDWLSDDLPATDEIDIFLIADNQLVAVAEGLPATDTSYLWTVPEVFADDAFLSIDSSDAVTGDLSAIAGSEPFTIADGTPPSPDPLTWEAEPQPADQTVLQMTATTATDAGGDVEYRFEFLDSPTGGAGGTGSGWIAASLYQDVGLDLNQRYCYAARARDAAGNTTAETPVSCAYTLAVAPTAGPFGRVSESSVEVRWGAAGNPAFTEYRALNVTTGAASGWQTATTWTSPGLAPDTAYAFRVRARNGDGVETAVVDVGVATTQLVDGDGDGIAWSADNCTEITNPDQRDTDADGYGNACDPDLNNDGIVNAIDLGLFKAVFFTTEPDADFNGDGVVNAIDLGIMRSGFFAPPGPSGVAP